MNFLDVDESPWQQPHRCESELGRCEHCDWRLSLTWGHILPGFLCSSKSELNPPDCPPSFVKYLQSHHDDDQNHCVAGICKFSIETVLGTYKEQSALSAFLIRFDILETF